MEETLRHEDGEPKKKTAETISAVPSVVQRAPIAR